MKVASLRREADINGHLSRVQLSTLQAFKQLFLQMLMHSSSCKVHTLKA